MKFLAMLWRGLRRREEHPPSRLAHRGGGLLEKPTPAGGPKKWEPPTKGTTVADRPRLRRQRARAARAARAARRNA